MMRGQISYKLSRGEISVANLKAPLQMVRVWVVIKSEKIHNLIWMGVIFVMIWAICKSGLLPNGPKWSNSEKILVKII